MKRRLSIALATSMLVGAFAPAALAAPAPENAVLLAAASAKQSRAARDVEDYLERVESRLAKGSPKRAESYFGSLRRAFLKLEGAELEAYRDKVYAMRGQMARAGGEIGGFEDWNYDGQDMAGMEKFLKTCEEALYEAHGAKQAGNDHRLGKQYDALASLFAHENFKNHAGLKHYREHFAAPQIEGIKNFVNQAKAKSFKYALEMAKKRADGGDASGAVMSVRECQAIYKHLKHANFDTASYKFALGQSELSLDEGMQEVERVVAQSKALEARAKAEAAAWAAGWKKSLKGDRAKLYAELGEPAVWDGPHKPEQAAKAPTWTYFQPDDKYFRWRVVYHFKGDKIVKQDRELQFVP